MTLHLLASGNFAEVGTPDGYGLFTDAYVYVSLFVHM